MHSLLPDYLAKLRFDAQQLATLRALGEYRGKQQLYLAQSPEVLSDLRQVAVVESTESSNRLEGVVVAAHRLKSLGLIHESGEQMPFSEGTVQQLHGILYRYMPQPHGTGSTSGRPAGTGAAGHPRFPLHPPLPRR